MTVTRQAAEHPSRASLHLARIKRSKIPQGASLGRHLCEACCHALQSRKSITSAESVLMATVDLDEQNRRVRSSSEASSSSEGHSLDEVKPSGRQSAGECMWKHFLPCQLSRARMRGEFRKSPCVTDRVACMWPAMQLGHRVSWVLCAALMQQHSAAQQAIPAYACCNL